MEKDCKLPINTLVKTSSREESRMVVNYLKDCGIDNPNSYVGTSPGKYGRQYQGICTEVTMFSTIRTEINYEEFLKLLSEPSSDIVNDYQIF